MRLIDILKQICVVFLCSELVASNTIPKESKLAAITNANSQKARTKFLSQSNDAKMKGISTVLGGLLAHLTYGTLYCWGNFLSYSPRSLVNQHS